MSLDETQSERRYWAFISHSHKDVAWASWLVRSLETYGVPANLVGRGTPVGPIPRRLRPVFRDRDDLAASPDLKHQLHRVLDHSRSMIVVCSPDAVNSTWVNEEIAYFRSVHGGERIFAIIVGGEPNAAPSGDLSAPECFPAALRSGIEPNPEDLTDYAQPIASDLRPGGDGKRLALLKLVAGILDVELDDLVHRDAQRRHRQMAVLAAGSFAGMLAMGGLAAVATSARNEAQRQRAQAEGLIEFMLVDLRKTLEPAGKLDALGSVGQRALQYYEAQATKSLDADSLGRRSRVLHLIGDVDDQKGDLTSALKVFQQAAKSTGELLAREPNDPQRIFDHAQSVYWVGYIAWRRGQSEEARRRFTEYAVLADHLVAIDPKNDDWQAEVGYANTNLGTVLLEDGGAAEALDAFERSLETKIQLARHAPIDRGRQADLGQAYAWKADAEVSNDNLAAAKAARVSEREIYKALLLTQRGDAAISQALIANRQTMAKILWRERLALEARTEMRTAVAEALDLVRSNPDNTQYLQLAASSHLLLGQIDLAFDHRAEAQASAEQAVRLSEGLVQKDPTVAEWSGR